MLNLGHFRYVFPKGRNVAVAHDLIGVLEAPRAENLKLCEFLEISCNFIKNMEFHTFPTFALFALRSVYGREDSSFVCCK